MRDRIFDINFNSSKNTHFAYIFWQGVSQEYSFREKTVSQKIRSTEDIEVKGLGSGLLLCFASELSLFFPLQNYDVLLKKYRIGRMLCFILKHDDRSYFVCSKHAFIPQFSCFSKLVRDFQLNRTIQQNCRVKEMTDYNGKKSHSAEKGALNNYFFQTGISYESYERGFL